MFSAQLDQPANLLTSTFSGDVRANEMPPFLERIRTLLNDSQPGLRVFTDLGGLNSMETSCAPYIKEAMDLLKEKQVTVVVRVIPDPRKDIGFEIMSLFHYGKEVQIVTVDNVDEAMQYLQK